MAKTYVVTLTDTLTFKLRADDRDAAQDYLNQHSVAQASSELHAAGKHGNKYYDDSIDGVTDQTPDLDISTKKRGITDNRKADILEKVIDSLINRDGMDVNGTIEVLLESGASKDELLEMGFSETKVKDITDFYN